MSARLVILDRDGVINHDSDGYLRSSEQWHAIDGSLEAIALLCASDFTISIASNQSGLARGLFDQAALNEIHGTLKTAVTDAGGRIDRIVYCPHGPEDACDCRKPAPGLLLRLAEHYGVSLVGVPFIGDSVRDLRAAQAAGARGILVRTGNGRGAEESLLKHDEDVEVYNNLLQAARQLVAERTQ